MIIETRVFNKRTKKMIYLPPLKAGGGGVFATAKEFQIEPLEPSDPIMLKTCLPDINGNMLWEGDIVELGVLTSYGAVKERGIVVWRPDLNQFTVNINNNYEGAVQFEVVEPIKLGNIYENPDMVKVPSAKDINDLQSNAGTKK